MAERENDDMESRLVAQESSDDTPSCSTTDACDWQVVSATVPGAVHKRNDASNQDALRWWSAEEEKALAVLCVSDGHGGREYRRSDIGARCAVKQAQALLVNEVIPQVLDGSNLTRSGTVQATPHSTAAETPREPVAGIYL